jgi:DNA-directed RNA polymerase specialized sigma24 family protein
MPPAGSVRTESIQYRAWQMREAGRSIEDICEAFDKTRDEVNNMLGRARKQIAKAST